MNKILSRLALAALALAALVLLFFVIRDGGRPGEYPAAPEPAAVLPAEPAAAAVKVKPIHRKRNQAGKAVSSKKTAVVPVKREKRRKKRDSRLREPGDAMGGGVYIDSAAKANGLR